MTVSGYDCWKRKGLSRRRKPENVGADIAVKAVLALCRLPASVLCSISADGRLALSYRLWTGQFGSLGTDYGTGRRIW